VRRNRNRSLLLLALTLASGTAACRSGGGGTSAMPDGGPAPNLDGGPSPDEDGGRPPEDAGPADAGPADAGPPPDPFALSGQRSTTVVDAMRPWFEGPDAMQTGVTVEIARHRASVIAGYVYEVGGTPLADATVQVVGHPELGETLTREDGRFDLVVNGGGILRVRIEKDGRIPAARHAEVLWGEWVTVRDTVLVPFDDAVTTIDLTRTDVPVQIHRGTMTADGRGDRQATMMVPMGTSATVTLPDGTTTPLPETFSLRLTEVTVGPDGPDAMPGELPPNSAYTYAVEVTIEEVDAMGATSVDFDRPQPIYVENFLDYPVGTVVPHGQFSVLTGQWEPQPDGLIVRVSAVEDGVAVLDVDDTGPASAEILTELGITDDERATLADLYAPGDELWRVPLVRMTSLGDFNFSFFCNPTCPNQIDADEGDEPEEGFCDAPGSRIDLDNQAIAERVRLAGTPYALTYKSNRVRGFRAAYQFEVNPFGGRPVHPDATDMAVWANVAGALLTMPRFEPTESSRPFFEWDGLDFLGRRVQGVQTAQVTVAYGVTGFRGCWRRLDCVGPSFMQSCRLDRCGGSRVDVYIYLRDQVNVGLHDYTQRDLGGWGLDVQHVYEPARRQLLLGTGDVRPAGSFGLVTEILGGARDGGAGSSHSPAVGPDGTVFFVRNQAVYRIDPNGEETRFAGDRVANGFAGDGGPAVDALLNQPRGLDLREDGSLLIVDRGNRRVRIVGPDGTIDTFAGNGDTPAFRGEGDGGPAMDAPIQGPAEVAVAPDGSVYITSGGGLKRVLTDGTFVSVMPGQRGFPPDAVEAEAAEMFGLADGPIAIDDEGGVYVKLAYSGWEGLVWRIDPSGVATREVGFRCRSGCPGPLDAEGKTVDEVTLGSSGGAVGGLAIAPTGELVVARQGGGTKHVWIIGDDRVIRYLAGGGDAFRPRGAPARSVRTNDVRGIAFAPDGRLVFMDGHTAMALTPPLRGLDIDEHLVPSRDGREAYVFDLGGVHQRTLDARTGALLRSFGYDATGRLDKVTERGGLVTTFERDADGLVERVVGPHGAVTELTHDDDGLLTTVTDPAGHENAFTYHGAGGLLATRVDPRGETHAYAYDEDTGRLISDTGPTGGVTNVTGTRAGATRSVELTSPEGRTVSYESSRDAAGARRIRVRPGDGPETVVTSLPGFRDEVRTPDGTVASRLYGADPRWGVATRSPTEWLLELPSGATLAGAQSKTATLEVPVDPLTLVSATRSWGVGGDLTTASWDAETRALTTTSPGGREVVLRFDEEGRLVERLTSGLSSETRSYVDGRLAQIVRGGGTSARTTELGYDEEGRLINVMDPLGRVLTLGYDAADRLSGRTLPDGREVGIAYDAMGRATSVTPPGRNAHRILRDEAGRAMGFDPPDVPGVDEDDLAYERDRDGRLTRVVRPGGAVVSLEHDGFGRVTRVTSPAGDAVVTYDGSSGRPVRVASPEGATLDYVWDGAVLDSWSWSGDVAGTVSVTRNDKLQVIASQVNGRPSVAYGYDADGLPTSAGALALTRDTDHGRVTATAIGQVETSHGYDSFGAVVSFAATHDGDPLFSQTLTRDGGGRVTRVVESVRGSASTTHDYAYDATGRLVSETTGGSPAASYAWDDNGNLTSKTDAGATVTATYDAQDRLATWGATEVPHDDDGQLEVLPGTVGGGSMSYDAFGQLVGAELPGGTVVTYELDAVHRRVGKRVDGILVRGWLYRDGLAPIAELDGDGAVRAEFVYAEKRHVPSTILREGVTYRVISDERGSVRLVVDVATGDVAQRLDYDPLGRVTSDTNPGFQPFGYAGGLYDPDTRLVSLGAREYAPALGRWLVPDPTGFATGGTNRYAYAANDPINLVDVTGYGPAPTVYLGFCGAACGQSLGFGDQISVGWEQGEVGWIPPYWGTLDYVWVDGGLELNLQVGGVWPGLTVPVQPPGAPPGGATTVSPPPPTTPSSAPPGSPPGGGGAPGVILPGLTALPVTVADTDDLVTPVGPVDLVCVANDDDLLVEVDQDPPIVGPVNWDGDGPIYDPGPPMVGPSQ